MTKMIGLTGPTGAGKSTAAEAFRSLGAEVIDCDRLAGDVLTFPACIRQLQQAFGEDIVSGGCVNRALLAQKAFSGPEETKKLNAITHPAIIEEMRRRMDEYKKEGASAVLIDGALLFESGVYRLFDTTVVVLADRELRLERIMKRDGISRRQAEERASAQKDDQYYLSRAGYVLDGGKGPDFLKNQVKDVFGRILEE